MTSEVTEKASASPQRAKSRGKAKRGTAGVDQKIYDSVFNAVMSQRLPPGTKLVEGNLCELFRVSRTIVRKALQQLAHDHIIDLRPNRGATVASPTPQETREIFAARRIVEAAVIPLVIEKATKAQLAQLRQHVQEEHAALDGGDPSDWIRLTGEFHMELAEVAGNSVLTGFVNEVVSRCSLIIALYDARTSVPCAHDEHEQLIDVIANRDVPRALKMMDEHLLSIERRLKLEEEPREINLAEILGGA
ncbi:MAG TPA: GntR family transcriptional regulator [Burkholderiales bacterium]|nr:GntR family transcriptional regulator [Burkholderiales bacterium]